MTAAAVDIHTPPFTTVKVSRDIHAKLKEGAKAFHSIDEYLAYLLKMEKRRQMIESMRVAIANTSPEDMESWREEAREWERAELEDMAATGI